MTTPDRCTACGRTYDVTKVCIDCGVAFSITSQEVAWYARLDYLIPNRCRPCRVKRRGSQRARTMLRPDTAGDRPTFDTRPK